MGLHQSKSQIRITPKGITVSVTPARLSVTPIQHRPTISPKIRDAVWTKYNGTGNKGTCYCCGTGINRYNAGWHCSHVIALHKNGNSTVDNLRTCCQHCNLSMGDQNMYTYIKQKRLTGPGVRNVDSYLQLNPSQRHDKRTNNWRI